MTQRPRRRSTSRSAKRTRPAKPTKRQVLREVEEVLTKDEWERRRQLFEVDGAGRVRHGWHAANTLYARVSSAWVKVAYWCAKCKVGQLLPRSTSTVDR